MVLLCMLILSMVSLPTLSRLAPDYYRTPLYNRRVIGVMERLHKNFTKEAVEVVGPPAWKVIGPTLKKGFNDAMGQLKKFKFDKGIRNKRKGTENSDKTEEVAKK